MRDQFLDELGGVHVPPESAKGAGRLEVTIDERVAGRPLDEHGERAAAARSTVWPWVVGAIDRTHEAEIFFSLAPTTGVSLPAVDNFQLLFRSAL